jgi:hypothetical protein
VKEEEKNCALVCMMSFAIVMATNEELAVMAEAATGGIGLVVRRRTKKTRSEGVVVAVYPAARRSLVQLRHSAVWFNPIGFGFKAEGQSFGTAPLFGPINIVPSSLFVARGLGVYQVLWRGAAASNKNGAGGNRK